jgi:hypothetical protein
MPKRTIPLAESHIEEAALDGRILSGLDMIQKNNHLSEKKRCLHE